MNENIVNGKYFINDISRDLMSFYQNVTNPQMLEELNKINKEWCIVHSISDTLVNHYSDDVISGIRNGKRLPLIDDDIAFFESVIKENIRYDFHNIDYIGIFKKNFFDKINRGTAKKNR